MKKVKKAKKIKTHVPKKVKKLKGKKHMGQGNRIARKAAAKQEEHEKNKARRGVLAKTSGKKGKRRDNDGQFA